jgi:hypothetical protein
LFATVEAGGLDPVIFSHLQMHFDAEEIRKLAPTGYTLITFASPVSMV